MTPHYASQRRNLNPSYKALCVCVKCGLQREKKKQVYYMKSCKIKPSFPVSHKRNEPLGNRRQCPTQSKYFKHTSLCSTPITVQIHYFNLKTLTIFQMNQYIKFLVLPLLEYFFQQNDNINPPFKVLISRDSILFKSVQIKIRNSEEV